MALSPWRGCKDEPDLSPQFGDIRDHIPGSESPNLPQPNGFKCSVN